MLALSHLRTRARAACSPAPALALAFVASAVPLNVLAASSDVSFRFAWPTPSHANVTYQSEVRRTEGGWASPTRQKSVYTLSVEAVPGGVRVAKPGPTDDASPWTAHEKDDFWGPAASQPLEQQDVQALIDEAGEEVPILLVSRSGQLLSVEGTEDLVLRMNRVLLRSPLSEATREPLRQLYTAEFLRARAADLWSSTIGMWAGQSAKPGHTRRLVQAISFPGVRRPLRVP